MKKRKRTGTTPEESKLRSAFGRNSDFELPQPWPAQAPAAPPEVEPSLHISSNPTPAFDQENVSHPSFEERGTIVYVHGIANKPPAAVLKCQWDHALFGKGVGERSRMVYWVNRIRHGEPSPGSCADIDSSDESSASMFQSGVEPQSFREMAAFDSRDDFARELAAGVCPDSDINATNALGNLAEKLLSSRSLDESSGAEAIPLPRGIRQWLTRQITWLLLGDVYDYLYDAEFMRRVDLQFRRRFLSGGAPFVVIGHSLGSVIAYKNLIELKKENVIDTIPLFLTIGSPLGLTEIQDRLQELLGTSQLVAPAFIEKWVNVYDFLDPVAADGRLSNDFPAQKNSIEDKQEANLDSPRHPHSASGYLATSFVRNLIKSFTGSRFGQEITDFVIASDLSERLEEKSAEANVYESESTSFSQNSSFEEEILIELSDIQNSSNGNGPPLSLEDSKQLVLAELNRIRGPHAAQIRILERYIAVSLTPVEIETLANRLGKKAVHRIWSDSQKFALMQQSIQTVHAAPAHRSYQAYGAGVTWAVLDTGINPLHPHFHPASDPTVTTIWDCTSGNQIQQGDSSLQHSPGWDRNGHGTHVAGIIAGGQRTSDQDTLLASMSPLAKLHSYKVLGDDGIGRDSSIIMALDHIVKINRESQKLIIHGVNLSLGGTFNPKTYGCGHTPICRELYQLWRQGVVVVVSAGNSGFAILESTQGPLQANMDLSIGDPANLEDSIAVGSVHKTNPWTHGVSFFSSRGPTADGRQKPDLVAPGERIESANFKYDGRAETMYVELSGTSMAAPHVSGILAGFLSRRQEFIGRPDQVKQILLSNCTSIDRSEQHQGAGIPNLVKMLENT